MNIYWYSLVFGLLVLRAIAPPPLPEHLPSHGEIPRGIAEQLGPPLERVGSGPLEGVPQQLKEGSPTAVTLQGSPDVSMVQLPCRLLERPMFN
ncbi:hypothetical protein Pst134EA_023016 [Puccinia striiformis f. sp. tritici]|uniref:hypothetical protein n=1 Tax=Puccinia striiformis f. sp. tritici TaxID=168172 RepID=UPI0020076453|nr:hypothetical protein Pst134EA_023016 [Puccinia striiformis f. sp. tritici]KAH9455557.1 hypothetical protein Pst134EA_023016 [Puccinia striiformis f. sp. tritici]